MLKQADFFGDQELVLLYIARRLKEALALEKVLDGAGLDYLVETDTYRGGFIFVSERIGAFFYSTDADAGRARTAMLEAGYKPYQPGE